MDLLFHTLRGEKVCKKVAGHRRRRSENIFQLLMRGSPALCWPGFCKLCKQIKFQQFGFCFSPPFNVSVFLLKVSPGSETFHRCCGKGAAGECSRENSHNDRSLDLLNVFSKTNFSSQICFYDSHSFFHTKQVRYGKQLHCPAQIFVATFCP